MKYEEAICLDLSDRTLLNEIFEHENCSKIKIYRHEREDGTDDFREKTFSIGRCFNDKQLFRKRVVPKDDLPLFPKLIR
jgi:hypothetical protein